MARDANSGREPRSGKGYDISNALMEEFKVKGTAGYEVVFVAPDGERFTVLEVLTDSQAKETQVLLLEEGK